ncbi:MAG: hypothetical protein GSR84_08150 [Desulfurococcales archaeon]|nr:hypothetical protein [Desulfurococcales archaeon]
MEYRRLVALFSIYMILLYTWAAYLEYNALVACDKPYRVFFHKTLGIGTDSVWFKLFIAPTLLYLVAALLLAPLAVSPGLVWNRRYRMVMALALAPFATAWISSTMFMCLSWGEVYEVIRSAWWLEAWVAVGYPLAYIAYAYLAYRVFEPLIGGVNPADLMPRFHSVSTRIARILAAPLLGVAVISVILLAMLSPFGITAALAYPAIGLWLAGFSRLRWRPYRFLIAFPLLGQAACWRTFTFDMELLVNIALGSGPGGIQQGVASLLAPLLVARWALFPLPGFGGAQASMALADFLEYRLLGELYWVASPPTMLTPLWLLGEWLIFYKALTRGGPKPI